MYCQNRIVYTVQEGDSLYQLSRRFDTTVTELILGNPGVNPYNLQVGMRLNICPGEEYDGPQMPGMNDGNRPGNQMPGMNDGNRPGNRPGAQMPGMNDGNRPGNRPGNQMPGMNDGMRPDGQMQTPGEIGNSVQQLLESMRLAWLSMLYWNRMYLMSIASDEDDKQAIEERALETADEVTDVFAEFLPINVVRQLRNLFTTHVELYGEIVRALESDNQENSDEQIREWYDNANQIATLLGNQNPYFGSRETRNLLLNHLDMTRESTELWINGEYGRSIDVFRDMKKQVLEMADYFARGLLAR